MITFLVYLNGDYDGGETEFPKVGLSHKGSSAKACISSTRMPDGKPDLRTVHAGPAADTRRKMDFFAVHSGPAGADIDAHAVTAPEARTIQGITYNLEQRGENGDKANE